MNDQIIHMGPGHLIPARVLKEDDETLTLQVAKDDKFQFKLSEDSSKNQFYTIAFFKSTVPGQMAVWRPWEGE